MVKRGSYAIVFNNMDSRTAMAGIKKDSRYLRLLQCFALCVREVGGGNCMVRRIRDSSRGSFHFLGKVTIDWHCVPRMRAVGGSAYMNRGEIT